jgi:diguanylate cyclase (GGDEF)-like protein/PAS domain S-box-containing protein
VSKLPLDRPAPSTEADLQVSFSDEAPAGWGRQAAILDALSAQVVLLDADGVILSENAAWRKFVDAKGFCDPLHAVGRNYLAACDAVVGAGVSQAVRAAAGIRSVLRGSADSFTLEYECDSPTEERSFIMTVTPIEQGGARCAVVMHVDITARKRGEEALLRFAAAMDATPDAIFLFDCGAMSTVYVNAAACRMHQCTREELLASDPWGLFGMPRREPEEARVDLLTGEGAATVELLWSRRNAAPIWVEIRQQVQLIGDRHTVVIQARDVSARKESESRIAYLNRVRAVLSGINTALVRVRDRGELFRQACRVAVDDGALAMAWIGLVDKNLNRLVLKASAGMDEEMISTITRRMEVHAIDSPGNWLPRRAINEKRAIVSENAQRDAKVQLGEMYALYGINSLAIVPLIVADEAVGVLVLYARESGFFHPEEMHLLTELADNVVFAIDHIEKQERLDYLAYYDVLTGLANRTLFLERLTQYVRDAESGGHKLALYLIDLERFRNINATLGRAAGDTLLRQVAQWLTEYTCDAGLLARIDGDRFAVVIPAVIDEEEADRILQKGIDALLHHPFDLAGMDYRIAAKFGVAMFPDDGDDPDLLCKHAEAALKKAKTGGDRYLFYAHKMTETVAVRLSLENQLRLALECDQYVLHYQPKMDLISGKVVGAEALIRWNDPRNGLVPPARFISILEETGLIHEVGRWALRKALDDQLRWCRAGLRCVRTAVNLSARQLRNRDFIAEIREVIGRDPSAGAGLELEITESLIMDDVKLSIANLQTIRAMGVHIAIDDFGTGFSSLSYLAKLPVDTLKIDRSFITEMANGPDRLSLVSVIINLAHSLNLKVVAEGVETQEQARLLRLLRCDEMQGFLLGEPMPAAAFAERFLTVTEVAATA